MKLATVFVCKRFQDRLQFGQFKSHSVSPILLMSRRLQYLSRMRSIYHACAILAWNLAQGHTSWVTPMAIARLSPKFWKTLTALDRKIWSSVRTWSRGEGWPRPPLIFKMSAKKIVFFVTHGKTNLHHFWQPLEKLFEKSTSGSPPGKKFQRPCVCMKYNTGFIVDLDVNESFLDGEVAFAYAS